MLREILTNESAYLIDLEHEDRENMTSNLDAITRDSKLCNDLCSKISVEFFLECKERRRDGYESVNTTIGREQNKNLPVVDSRSVENLRCHRERRMFARSKKIVSQLSRT